MANSFAARWAAGDVFTAAEANKVGLVYIGDTTLGSDQSSISIAGITGGFAHLLVLATLRNSGTSNNPEAKIRFNDDAATDYYDENGSTETSGLVGRMTEDDLSADIFAAFRIDVLDYTSTSRKKTWISVCAVKGAVTSPFTATSSVYGGNWLKTPEAITKVTLLPAADSLNAGSRMSIYGYNDGA